MSRAGSSCAWRKSPPPRSFASSTRAGSRRHHVPSDPPLLGGDGLTSAISAAIVELYREHCGHDRTTVSTYINDNIVLCVLEDILTTSESALVSQGARREVIDARVAFQEGAEDEFTAAIERLTGRRVVAFLSANQTHPGIASELFFLEPPATEADGGG